MRYQQVKYLNHLQLSHPDDRNFIAARTCEDGEVPYFQDVALKWVRAGANNRPHAIRKCCYSDVSFIRRVYLH